MQSISWFFAESRQFCKFFVCFFITISAGCHSSSTFDSAPVYQCTETDILVAACETELIKQFTTFDLARSSFNEARLASLKQKGDPLQLLMYAWGELMLGVQENDAAFLLDAEKNMNYLVESHQPAERSNATLRLSYKQPTDYFSAGWWSGMDGFLLPVVLMEFFKVTGNIKYKTAAEIAFNSITKNPANGGSVIDMANQKCWFSEYTDASTTTSNEYFVLNGHLFALQAVMYYAIQTKSLKAMELSRCGLLSYQDMSEKYKNRAMKWARYMLNYADGKTSINQTHYVIFEKIQIESIKNQLDFFPVFSKMNADFSVFLQGEIDYHSDILKENYPIYIDKNALIFLKSGPPHPYVVDTYRVILECSSSAGPIVIDETTLAGEASKRRLLEKNLTAGTAVTNCDVFSSLYGLKQKLFSTTPQSSDQISLEDGIVDVTAEATVDAIFDIKKKSGLQFEIDPAIVSNPADLNHYYNVTGRLVIKNLGLKTDFSALVFGMTMERSVPMAIGLVDEKGTEYFRYMPLPHPGENNFVFSPAGFEKMEEASENIDYINIYFYTDQLQEKFSVDLNGIQILNQKESYGSFLKSVDWSTITTD